MDLHKLMVPDLLDSSRPKKSHFANEAEYQLALYNWNREIPYFCHPYDERNWRKMVMELRNFLEQQLVFCRMDGKTEITMLWFDPQPNTPSEVYVVVPKFRYGDYEKTKGDLIFRYLYITWEIQKGE